MIRLLAAEASRRAQPSASKITQWPPKDAMNDQREFRRVPCQLDAICETIEGTPPVIASFPGSVLNLSCLGAGLAVSRQFRHTAPLFLKISDPTKTFWCGRSARVIHTFQAPLLLGCQFTARLSDSELQTLLGAIPAPERRMNPRFVPSTETLRHLTVTIKDHDLPVILNDISVGGMRIVVKQPFAQGAKLQVRLSNTTTNIHLTLMFQLLHVQKVGANWCLGGMLHEKITNQDLLLLLV